MTKTEFAFTCTASSLFAESDDVYFWTFTLVKVMPDWCYGRTWDHFLCAVSQHIDGNVSGVRVLEPHKLHGLHYHALVNRRLSVHFLRRIGKRFGFGRIHVKRADSGAISYLSKYLTKQFTREHKLHAGIRRWSSFGATTKSRVSDIEVDSPLARRARDFREAYGRPLKYHEWLALKRMHG